MKVLLISPNRLVEPYPVYPLGLDYVAGALAPRHSVRIADMNNLPDWDSLSEVIKGFGPDVIGISVRNIDNMDTASPKAFIEEYRTAAETARRSSDAVLVCGGSGFTMFPEQILSLLRADYGIIGEGERMALLLDALEKDEDAMAIPGVIGRNGGRGTSGPWEGDVLRIFDSRRPYVEFYLKNGGMLNLQTRRGCRLNCTYCSYPHVEGHRVRLSPPEEAARTAWELQEAGARYLFITDSAFNADVSHSLAVAKAFKKAGVTIPWGGFFVPSRTAPDYFHIMADAGLTHVEFGTESLCDDMLASYRKPFRQEQVFLSHEAALRAGLHVAHFLLLGGPGETRDTLNETLSRAELLEKAVLFFFCGVRIYPHTELFNTSVGEGKISKSDDLLGPVYYVPDSIDKDEIAERVRNRAKERCNWVLGSGGEAAGVVSRLYERGYSGPLWEHLIR